MENLIPQSKSDEISRELVARLGGIKLKYTFLCSRPLDNSLWKEREKAALEQLLGDLPSKDKQNALDYYNNIKFTYDPSNSLEKQV